MLILNTSNSYKVLTLVAALACAVTAQTAMAETKAATHVAAATTVDPDFAKLDSNHNGKISLKEAAKDKGLTVSFDAVDANKDGSINSNEFAAFKVASTGAAAPVEAMPAEVIEPVNAQ